MNPRQRSDRLKDLKAAGYKIVVKPRNVEAMWIGVRQGTSDARGSGSARASYPAGANSSRCSAWPPMVHAQQPTRMTPDQLTTPL